MKDSAIFLSGQEECSFWLTALCYLWLWFMLKRPEKWAMWVDRENNFWAFKGLVSAALAERCKRWEKGLPLKLAVGATAFLGGGGLVFWGYVLLRTGVLTR